MNRTLLVARCEILEHRRQPSMLLVLAFNYILWGAVFVMTLAIIDTAARSPETLRLLGQQAAALGISDGESALDALLKVATSTFGALLFTNLPLFVAIMSGYSVIHDRTWGTLPFLMLAPLSRYQLLLGKLLGAMAIPTAMHLGFIGVVTLMVRQFDVIAPFSDKFGGSPAWFIAYALGGPAAGFLVGSLGGVISGLARDVRTSMQFTSFFIGILSLIFGFILFDGISGGVAAQLAFVVASVVSGLLIVGAGSRIIKRDLAR